MKSLQIINEMLEELEILIRTTRDLIDSDQIWVDRAYQGRQLSRLLKQQEQLINLKNELEKI